jgi:hypothetical protein
MLLKNFENRVDKNILLTYMKYTCTYRQRSNLPFSFCYKEPKIDLVLNTIGDIFATNEGEKGAPSNSFVTGS